MHDGLFQSEIWSALKWGIIWFISCSTLGHISAPYNLDPKMFLKITCDKVNKTKVKEYGGLYSYKPIYIFKSKYCDFGLVSVGNWVTAIQYTIQDIVSEAAAGVKYLKYCVVMIN